MMISLQELRKREEEQRQAQQNHKTAGRFPWQAEELHTQGPVKFIRFLESL